MVWELQGEEEEEEEEEERGEKRREDCVYERCMKLGILMVL